MISVVKLCLEARRCDLVKKKKSLPLRVQVNSRHLDTRKIYFPLVAFTKFYQAIKFSR